MDSHKDLLKFNKQWAAERIAEDPHFFEALCEIQEPEFLWIGCSDSRVPANQITGLQPGEVFVHRNIANVVPREDVNSASVIQFAVGTLKVKQIIVCGHYGCGGVKAAFGEQLEDPLEFWIEHLRRLRDKHADEIENLADDDARWRRLCELNVVTQVDNVARLRVVRDAWQRGQELTIRGWIYDLRDGLLKDLGVSRTAP
ncbi:MAG: carbonic anhydrase [Gammaproteobacteria bacterium]|nr:carbonic anhydrase [Gammaproteobacteria bacterium]